MGSSWRGYRPFILDGQRFRWACHFHYPIEVLSASYAKRGHTWRPDTLIVRPEDRPHCLLTITWPACHGPLVKPRFVRACIEEALRRGWLTDHRTLNLDGSELSIAGAAQPNHEMVQIVRDIVAGKQPHHPKVRRLEEGPSHGSVSHAFGLDVADGAAARPASQPVTPFCASG